MSQVKRENPGGKVQSASSLDSTLYSLALALYFRFLGKKGTSTQVALQLQGCTRISRPFRVSDSKVKGRQASVSTRLHQHPSSESSLSRYSCFPRSSLSPFESCLNTSATPRDCEEGVLRESERERKKEVEKKPASRRLQQSTSAVRMQQQQ